jgi:uroporphyrinogen-III synthase
MRWLVTRPQPQADEWVQRLRALGLDAVALPLLAIEPPASSAAALEAWRTLATQALVMFVSPNAVAKFFEQRPTGATWPAATWAGATGPGTVEALQALQVPSVCIRAPAPEAGQFDSEALWRELAPARDWRGAAVTIVRGEGGRDWLAQTLQQQGAQVRFVEAYRRAAPCWTDAERAALAVALGAPQDHTWLFSSSEAIAHLQSLVPGASWSTAQAWCTHPRIADRAREAGFGEVALIPAGFDGLVQACRCIQSPAP